MNQAFPKTYAISKAKICDHNQKWDFGTSLKKYFPKKNLFKYIILFTIIHALIMYIATKIEHDAPPKS